MVNTPIDSGFQRKPGLPYKHGIEEFEENINIIARNSEEIATIDKIRDCENPKVTLLALYYGGKLSMHMAKSISEISQRSLTGAHGIFASPDQKDLYVTNISGQQIYGLDASDNILKSTASAIEKTPHNVAINPDGNKLFVTHSGPTASIVLAYTVKNGFVSPRKTINVGKNPFRLVYYRRQVIISPTSCQNRLQIIPF